MKLIDVCNPKQWKTISASELVEDGYPVFGANGIIGYFSDYNHENPTLCITCRGATCGTVNKSLPYSYITGNSMPLDDLDESVITIDFLYYFLQYRGFDDVITGSAQPQITRQSLSKITVPEIDLNIQKNITNIIKRLEQLILIREKQREKFNMLVKSRFNEMFGDPVLNEVGWEIETLNKIGTIGRGISKHRPRNASELFGGIYPFIQTGDVANSGNYIVDYHSTYSEFGFKQSKLWDKGTLCITIAANIAKTSILAFDSCFPDSIVGFIPGEKTNNMFIHYWFSYFQKILESQAPESAQKNINLKILSELKVILPPLFLQNEFADFVAQVDKSQFACQMAIKLWRNSLKSSII